MSDQNTNAGGNTGLIIGGVAVIVLLLVVFVWSPWGGDDMDSSAEAAVEQVEDAADDAADGVAEAAEDAADAVEEATE